MDKTEKRGPGRPRMDPNKKKVSVGFSIVSEHWDMVRERALHENVGVSAWIVRLIQQELGVNKEQKAA